MVVICVLFTQFPPWSKCAVHFQYNFVSKNTRWESRAARPKYCGTILSWFLRLLPQNPLPRAQSPMYSHMHDFIPFCMPVAWWENKGGHEICCFVAQQGLQLSSEFCCFWGRSSVNALSYTFFKGNLTMILFCHY